MWTETSEQKTQCCLWSHNRLKSQKIPTVHHAQSLSINIYELLSLHLPICLALRPNWEKPVSQLCSMNTFTVINWKLHFQFTFLYTYILWQTEWYSMPKEVKILPLRKVSGLIGNRTRHPQHVIDESTCVYCFAYMSLFVECINKT